MGDAGGHDHVAGLDLLAVLAGDAVAPRRPQLDRCDHARFELGNEPPLEVEAVLDERLHRHGDVRRVVRQRCPAVVLERRVGQRHRQVGRKPSDLSSMPLGIAVRQVSSGGPNTRWSRPRVFRWAATDRP